MTKHDILRMAIESGLSDGPVFFNGLERFAVLVAAHEREACLKLVDEQIHNMTVLDSYPEQSGAIYQAIINIRARGEK
jgi:hypothetical protein